MLIVSEFAGVSVELKGTLLTNPYHISNLVKVLHKGLTMSDDEAMARMSQMAETVKWHDVDRWGEEFLKATTTILSKKKKDHDLD